MSRSSEEVKAHLRAQIAAIEAKVPSGALPHSKKANEDNYFILPTEPALGSSGTEKNRSSKKPRSFDCSEETFEEESERAFRKIERVAMLREQASVALRKKLLREGFSPEATEVAIERAVSCGLIDDLRYGDILIRSRLSQGHGIQGIEAELASLTIECSAIDGWPEEFLSNEPDELARALELLNRKPPRAKNRRDAAYRKLMQKGFGSSIASSAARLWVEDQGF